MDFVTISIDQSILDDEQQFQVQQRLLDQVVIQVDEKDKEEEGESNIGSPLPSVISLDSIAQNADFIAF